MELLRLCDPRRKLESDLDFVAFWTDVRDAVNIFVDHHVPHLPAASQAPYQILTLFVFALPYPSSPHVSDSSTGYLAPKTTTDMTPPPARGDGVRDTVISTENQEAISKFLRSSVLPSTDRKYGLRWGWFVQFIKDQGSADPFMRTLTPQERAGMVSLFMLSRHVAGKRDKAASAVTAVIRLHFSQEMQDTTFLDSAVVSSARTACLPNPQELRERRNSAPASTVKLPVCEEMITDMRERLVVNRTWSEEDMKLIMLYTGVCVGSSSPRG
jgi:hypothetical protein